MEGVGQPHGGPSRAHLQNNKNANDRDTEKDEVHVFKCPSVSETYSSAVGEGGGGRLPGHVMLSEPGRLALSGQPGCPPEQESRNHRKLTSSWDSLFSLATIYVKKEGESPFQEGHRSTTKAATSHTGCPHAQGWQRSRSVGFQG